MQKCRELVEAITAAGVESDLSSHPLTVVRDKSVCIKSEKRVQQGWDNEALDKNFCRADG